MRILAIASILGACSVSYALGPAVQSWTGGTRFASFFTSAQATPDMVGFQFSVNTNVDVSQFGIWNDNDANGLDQTHRVLLWRLSDQALLSDVTVTPGDTLISGFRYATGANVSLVTGTTYVIAADYWSGGLDGYISTPTSAVYDSAMTHIGAAAPAVVNSGYVMPTALVTTNRGRFGPNMIFTDPVPEPATMVALGLGAAALLRRRRK